MVTFFIKTYSNEDDTVLDLTCYDKSIGTVVESLSRNYIGVEINDLSDPII